MKSSPLTFTVERGTDYVLCDRASLPETGELWLPTEPPPTGPALGASVLFIRAPGVLLVPLGPGWVLIEQDSLHAPRGEERTGTERLVVADNIGERERVGSIELRSGWFAFVPAVSSTDRDWRSLEGSCDEGCTFAAAPGVFELWWMTAANARCARTDVELDEYWLLVPATDT